jgi:hypothetical protein
MDVDNISDNEILEYIARAYHVQKDVRNAIEELKHKGEASRRQFVPQYADYKNYLRNIKKANQAINKMADILYKHIISDTESVDGKRHGLINFPRSAIITEPIDWHYYNESRKIKYLGKVCFDREMLRRESLVPNKYDGIDDIIELFVKGYDAHGAVQGNWHGEETWSLRHRPDADDSSFYRNGNFMQNAVDEFNSIYGGTKAKAFIANPKYKTQKQQ